MALSDKYQEKRGEISNARKELIENIERWKELYPDEVAGIESGLNAWLEDVDKAVAKFDSDGYTSPLVYDKKDFNDAMAEAMSKVKKLREDERDDAAKAVEADILDSVRAVMCENINASLLSGAPTEVLNRAKLLGFAEQVGKAGYSVTSKIDFIGLCAVKADDGSYYFIDNSIVPGAPGYGKPLYLKDKSGNFVTTFKYADDPKRKEAGLIKMTDDSGEPFVVVDEKGKELKWAASQDKAFDFVFKGSTLQDVIDGKKGLEELAGHETLSKIVNGETVSDAEKEEMLTAVFRQLALECKDAIDNNASLTAEQKWDMNEALKAFYPEVRITKKGVLNEEIREMLRKEADEAVRTKIATTMSDDEDLKKMSKDDLEKMINAKVEEEYQSKVKQIEDRVYGDVFDEKTRPLKTASNQTKTFSDYLADASTVKLFKERKEKTDLTEADTKGAGFFENVIEQLDENLIRQQIAEIDQIGEKLQAEFSFTDGLFAGGKESIYGKLEGLNIVRDSNELFALNDLDECALMAGAIRIFGDDFEEQLEKFVEEHDSSRPFWDKALGDGEVKYADLNLHQKIHYFIEDYTEKAKDNNLRAVAMGIAEQLIGKTDGVDPESTEADDLFSVYASKAFERIKEVAKTIETEKTAEKNAEETKIETTTPAEEVTPAGDELKVDDSPAPVDTHTTDFDPSVGIIPEGRFSEEPVATTEIGGEKAPKPVDDKRAAAEQELIKRFDEMLAKDGINSEVFEKTFYDETIVDGFMSGEGKEFSEELATHFTSKEKGMAESFFKDLPKRVKDIDRQLSAKNLDDETYGKLILQREVRTLLEQGNREKNSGFEKQVYSSPSQQAWLLRQARERLEAKHEITQKVGDLEKEKGELKIIPDAKKEKKRHDKDPSKGKSKATVGGFSSVDVKLKQLEKVCGYIDKLYAGAGVPYIAPTTGATPPVTPDPPIPTPPTPSVTPTPPLDVIHSVRHTMAVRDMACDVVWESMFRTVDEKFDDKYKGYIGKKNMAMVALASGHFPETDAEAMEKFGITQTALIDHMQNLFYNTRKNKMIRDTIRDVLNPEKGVRIEGVTRENVNSAEGKNAVEAWVTAQLGVLAGADEHGRFIIDKGGEKSSLLPVMDGKILSNRAVARYVLNEVLKGQNNPSDIRVGDKDLDDRRRNNHLYNALGRAGWSIDLEETMCNIEECIREGSVKDPESLLSSLEKGETKEKVIELENGESINAIAKEIDGEIVYIDPETNTIISNEKTEMKDADSKKEVVDKVVGDHIAKVENVQDKTQDQIKQGKEKLSRSDLGL